MKFPSISQRAALAPPSPIRKLVPLAESAKKRGIKVYHLNIGQPDFKIPPKIQKELEKAASLDYLPYASSLGITENILAWKKYYGKVGVSLETGEIIVTTGGSEALLLSMAAVSDPGDEILTFEPFYANYLGFANLLSAKIVPVPLNPSSGYHLPERKIIEGKISKRMKAILVTNPNNPTGTVFSKKELLLILEIAGKYNLFIIADETYRGICFDGKRCYSFLEICKKADRQRIITTDSVSKRLNICGARIGAIICKNRGILAALNAFCQARLSSPTIEQLIVSSAIYDLSYVKYLSLEYKKRRDAFIKTLEFELAIKIHSPEGAFYTMVKLPISDTDHFAAWMLSSFSYQKQTVMVAPGSGFYATDGMGKDEIRVAYVLNEKEMTAAAKILARGVREYREIKNKISNIKNK